MLILLHIAVGLTNLLKTIFFYTQNSMLYLKNFQRVNESLFITQKTLFLPELAVHETMKVYDEYNIEGCIRDNRG